MNEKSFLEFFAGIGLVRLGLENAGWKCSWANDISADKENIYARNFGKAHFQLEDIWKIKEGDISGKPFSATASFPCTDLSIAGQREGLAGEESGTVCGFFNVIRSMKNKKRAPKLIMLENVVGLLSSDNGSDIRTIIKELNSLGYIVDIILINAALFVPQSRPRVFIFGVEASIASDVMVTAGAGEIFSEWWNIILQQEQIRPKAVINTLLGNPDLKLGAFRLPKIIPSQTKLCDILEQIDLDSPLWWEEEKVNKIYSQMSELHVNRLKGMAEGSEYSYGTIYRRKRAGGSMAELRTDGIAGCLRTPRGGSSKQILLMAGKGSFHIRWMTPREYARLQGVHEKYALHENDTKSLFGIGDAVCVPVIHWIGENIFNPVYSLSKNRIRLSTRVTSQK